ncbi:MAG: hypothetical protein R3C69_16275 [Geminicoccaceae bacterium]
MQERPFGGWPSPLSAAKATGAQNRLGQIVLDGERVLWLEGRPAEGGRVSLMALDRPGGGRQATELTPAPLNVRTRLHEYGGSCVAARDGLVVLVNDRDQRLYRRDADGSIRPISPDTGGSLRFAEPLIDWQRQRVVAVAEDHRTGGEPANLLVAPPLAGGEPVILAESHDFFACPRLSSDAAAGSPGWSGTIRTCPDATRLDDSTAGFDGTPTDVSCVAGAGGGEAVLQPEFLPDGRPHQRPHGLLEPLAGGRRGTSWSDSDFGGPLWQVGNRWWTPIDARRCLVAWGEDGLGRLGILHLEDGRLATMDLPFADFTEIHAAGGRAVFRGSALDRTAEIAALDLESRKLEIFCAAGAELDPA